MNIFFLSEHPVVAARMHCDKLVVKMVLETAQLLCSVFEPGTAPYKRTHYNHPCAVWVRGWYGHYNWLYNHGIALAEEYTFRYGKRHKSQDVIEWCKSQILEPPSEELRDLPPECMPEEYRTSVERDGIMVPGMLSDIVKSYREYYKAEKAYFAKWERGREAPDWWKENG